LRHDRDLFSMEELTSTASILVGNTARRAGTYSEVSDFRREAAAL
jgi:hypothetical protein